MLTTIHMSTRPEGFLDLDKILLQRLIVGSPTAMAAISDGSDSLNSCIVEFLDTSDKVTTRDDAEAVSKNKLT